MRIRSGTASCETNIENREESKTPSKVLPESPKSNRSRCDSDPVAVINTQEPKALYICKICRNSESLRSTLLDINTDTLLGKLKRANDTFPESMTKIENLSVNLRHFLGFNTEKPETQQLLLSNIENGLSELINKSRKLEDSIDKNEGMLKSLEESIINYSKQHTNTKNYVSDPASTSTSNSHIRNNKYDTTTAPFSIGASGQRIIHKMFPISDNPTKYIEEINENFLPNELRETLSQYLHNSSEIFSKSGLCETVSFGQHYKTASAKGKKNNLDIPTPLMAVIDHIHESCVQSCPTGRTYELNSVTITKYTGSGTRYPESSDNDPNINPDSNIFTISLGDSYPVTFRDKCTGEAVEVVVSDNSLYSMSLKSQYYWTHKIDIPVKSETSVRFAVTFRSVNRRNRNSVLVVGDSNTHHVYFHHEKYRSDLGKEIYGRRIKAYTINEINHFDCVGFQNVMVQAGLNNIKSKY